jgi:site-specific recombinase XerD
MTLSTGQRRHHFKNTAPRDPVITPFSAWPVPNRSFQHSFYQWLKSGGYGPSSLNTYSVAARLALGYLNKLHWTIDPETDIALVRSYLEQRYANESTRREYDKGLNKLAEYLRLRQDKAARPHLVNWNYYLNGLPDWLCQHVRDFAAHKQKGWRPEERYRGTLGTLGPLCQVLRWMASAAALNGIGDITPQVWFDYLDARMIKGSHPNTINNHLFRMRAFLHFLDEAGEPVCQRMLLVPPLKSGPRLPKDAPVSQLRLLLQEICQEISAEHASRQRMGVLDRAWVHLMLQSGLRTCEVRRLRLDNIDWENRRIRIEQSKGLKDRLVYMNSATAEALRAWLDVRGEAEFLSDHVFLYRHQPLSSRYCQVRLHTYGSRCRIRITPHQLRHSCATLLLNAGAPVVTVQTLLGHEKVDTTLGYARLYDGTVAADYYRAMGQIERLFALPENRQVSVSTPAELVALVDSLGSGTLNETQRETIQVLREGIISLAARENVRV